MVTASFSARYAAAMAECGGRCPIEVGVIGRLADHECRHGRLPYDRTPACGCWPQEGAAQLILPATRSIGASSRAAASGRYPVRGDTTGNTPGSRRVAFNAIAEHLDHGRRYTIRTDQVQRSFEDTSLNSGPSSPCSRREQPRLAGR